MLDPSHEDSTEPSVSLSLLAPDNDYFGTSESKLTTRYQDVLTQMMYAKYSEKMLLGCPITRVYGSTVQFFEEGMWLLFLVYQELYLIVLESRSRFR
jgi:hypothetical protein